MSIWNIRVGFSTSTAWYSDVIRSVTKAKCSHAFTIVNVMGTDLVFEEAWDGYTTRTLDGMEKTGSKIVQILKPPFDVDFGFERSFHWLGQRYDYTGLFGMIPVMVERFFRHKTITNPLASSHAMFCSEETTRMLQFANYPDANKLDPRVTDPEDLRLFMLNTGSMSILDVTG